MSIYRLGVAMLESLEGCPIGLKSLECSYTRIKSFIGCSPNVDTIVAAFTTLLESFDGSPRRMKLMYATSARIRELKGCGNLITSLEGSQEGLACNNAIASCGGCAKGVKELRISGNLIETIAIDWEGLEILECSKNRIARIIESPDSLKELFGGDNPIRYSSGRRQAVCLSFLCFFFEYI